MATPNTSPHPRKLNIPTLYARFESPILQLDCGTKCAVYNEHGVPFCCDSKHILPSAYLEEWAYLNAATDLWHLWQTDLIEESARLEAVTPPNQVLIECLGHKHCQRDFRALTCRAFPFFPYIDQAGKFTGLSYYWQYRELCWVINHLEAVTPEFQKEFIQVYDLIFSESVAELDQFQYHSRIMRQVFGKRHESIPLLHRDGQLVLVNTRTGSLTPLNPLELPKYGPYEIADRLRFPTDTP